MKLILDSITQKTRIHSHLILVVIFAILYWISGKIERYFEMTVIDNYGRETKEKVVSMSFFRCLYFSLITQTTVGYGHYDPPTIISETVNILQLLSILGVYLF